MSSINNLNNLNNVEKVEQFIAEYSENNKELSQYYILNKAHDFIFENNLDILNLLNEVKLNKYQKLALAYNVIDFIILNSNNNKIKDNIDENHIKNNYVNILNKYNHTIIFNNIANQVEQIEQAENKVEQSTQINHVEKVEKVEQSTQINHVEKVEKVDQSTQINQVETKVNQIDQENVKEEEKLEETKIDQRILEKVIKSKKTRIPKYNSPILEKVIQEKQIEKEEEYNKKLYISCAKDLPKFVKSPVKDKKQEEKIEKQLTNPTANKSDSGFVFLNEYINTNFLNKKNDDGTPINWKDITDIVYNYIDEIDPLLQSIDLKYKFDDFQYFKSSSTTKTFHAFHIVKKLWVHFQCELNEKSHIKYDTIDILKLEDLKKMLYSINKV